MNPEKILKVLFILIDAIHDMWLVEWCDLVEGNLEYLISDLSDAEKLELKDRLMSLNLKFNTYQWHRRFNLCVKIHELI